MILILMALIIVNRHAWSVLTSAQRMYKFRSAFNVGRKNTELFLARLSLHARYTVRMMLQSVNTDGHDGLTKARPYIKSDSH